MSKLEYNETFLQIDKAKTVEDLRKVCLFLLDKISELNNEVERIKDKDFWADNNDY